MDKNDKECKVIRYIDNRNENSKEIECVDNSLKALKSLGT